MRCLDSKFHGSPTFLAKRSASPPFYPFCFRPRYRSISSQDSRDRQRKSHFDGPIDPKREYGPLDVTEAYATANNASETRGSDEIIPIVKNMEEEGISMRRGSPERRRLS